MKIGTQWHRQVDSVCLWAERFHLRRIEVSSIFVQYGHSDLYENVRGLYNVKVIPTRIDIDRNKLVYGKIIPEPAVGWRLFNLVFVKQL